MKLTLQVVPIDGEPYQVRTNLFTVVAWERKFKKPASTLANGIGAEDLAYLAYEACKQSNVPVPMSFDEFIRRTDAVEYVEVEATNPTAGEATDVS